MADRRGSLVSKDSTSPELSVALPPSPVSSEKPSSKPSLKPSSNIAAAIRLLNDRRKCILKDNWNPIQLQLSEYNELWRQLARKERDLLRYIEDKVHLDYDPERFEFVVRMPTTIHESFGGFIEKEIHKQLEIIRSSNNSAASVAREIKSIGSASIFLEDGARRDPDKEFAYIGTTYPGLVVEIAYSQRKKSLSRLADHYITESSGQIQMVIGFQLDYRGSKSAMVKVWCPMYGSDAEGRYIASNEVLSEEFRRRDGTSVTHKALRFQLKHLVPPQVEADPDVLTQEIIISYEQLASFLDEAEYIQHRKGTLGIPGLLEPGIRKRKRAETPPEELDSEDERTFKRLETTEATWAEERDEEWREK